MATTSQASGRELMCWAYDAIIAASPVADLFGRERIHAAAAGAWQPAPAKVVIGRVRGMELGRLPLDRLGHLAATLDAMAGQADYPEADAAWLLRAAASKVRGVRAVREYETSETARRIGMAMVTALVTGAAAQQEFGVSDAELEQHERMEELRRASAF